MQRGRLSPMRHANLSDGAFMLGGGEGALLSSNNLMAVETNSAFPSLIGFPDNSSAADMQRLSLLTPSLSADVVGGSGAGVGPISTERPQSLDTLLAEPPLQAEVPQSGTPTWLRPFHNDEFSPATGSGHPVAADSGVSMHDSAFSTDGGGHDDCGRLETSKLCSAAASPDGTPAPPSAAASLYAHWVHEPTSLAALGPHKSAPPVLPLRKLAGSSSFGPAASQHRVPMTMPLLDVAGSHGFRPISSCGLSTADIHGMASSLIGTPAAQLPAGPAGELTAFALVKREPDLAMANGLLHFQAASRHGFLKGEPDASVSPFDDGPPAKRSASGSLGSPQSNVTTWSPPGFRPSSLSAEPMAQPFDSIAMRAGGGELPASFTPHSALRTTVSCAAQL